MSPVPPCLIVCSVLCPSSRFSGLSSLGGFARGAAQYLSCCWDTNCNVESGHLLKKDAAKAYCCACTGRERVHRWWHTKQLADNRVIMGKPSVLHRKVVNTRVGDEIIAVNAQQYAVLVMDVPNLHKENRKCASP